MVERVLKIMASAHEKEVFKRHVNTFAEGTGAEELWLTQRKHDVEDFAFLVPVHSIAHCGPVYLIVACRQSRPLSDKD